MTGEKRLMRGLEAGGEGGGDTCSSVSTKIMFRETFSGFRLRVSCGLKWAGPMASLGRIVFSRCAASSIVWLFIYCHSLFRHALLCSTGLRQNRFFVYPLFLFVFNPIYLVLGRFWRTEWINPFLQIILVNLVLFFKSSWYKIASAARIWINSRDDLCLFLC